VSKAVNISVCMAADILMWCPYRLQLAAMNVHIGPQLVKSRTGVSKLRSIPWLGSHQAGLCHAFEYFVIFLLSTFDEITLHICKMPQSCSPIVTILYQAELLCKREAVNGTRFTNVR